jgi:SAM-dependent methyltransferase
MKRTENEQINTPEYWDEQYRSERGQGKQRFDDERKNFVLNAIRDVAQYFPNNPDLPFLDAGCGSAELLNLVHAVFPMWKKHGLDFSPEVISFCQRYNPHINFVCADVCRTGFQTQSVYLVHCGECLEHTDDPQRAVAELARITAPKGNIVISVPLMMQNPSPEHIWEFSIEDVIGLTAPYGELRDFKIVAGGLSVMTSTKVPWDGMGK